MLMRSAARKVAAPRQRIAEVTSFTAPIAGWISNRALAMPEGGPQGAALLENFFPTATGAVLRRGRQVYVQVSETGAVRSIFKYVVGANRHLFTATDDTIYDITTITSPINIQIGVLEDYDIGEPDDDYIIGETALSESQTVWEGATSGDWYTVQFSVTGGVFLIGVNGSSTGFIFDGTAFYPNVPGGVWTVSYDAGVTPFQAGEVVTGGTSGATGTVLEIIEGANPGEGGLILTGDAGLFENDETLTGSLGGEATASSDATSLAPGVTFPDGLTTADMAFVWVYKNSLWFVQKGTMTAWYLPVDSIGGTAKRFDLAPEFGQGGTLLIGQSWSLNASGQGGLSEQCVFVSSEGEVVVYQGINPDEASTWSKVGTYRIGIPMGRRAFIRAGGDLILATTIGFVSLSTAVQVDVAALAPKAVSYFIEDAWNTAVSQRGRENWVCCLWPESQMVAIAPPTGEQSPMFLVSNARTGAWAPFTNWDASCMEVFEGQLYFGTPDGYVMAAMVAGTDDGIPFTGSYVPLFTDAGKPTMRKAARMALAELISASEINEKLSCKFDFDLSLPAPPDVEPIPVGNEWDNAVWNESIWSADRGAIETKRRHSVSGHGYRIAPVLQITSGVVVPLDAQIVALSVTYESGDIFT
jgi:hypothetical protein